jgi:CRP-like cAMP-binding protein
LLALATPRRAEIPATATVEIRLTGQELANYCALTRESVSKQLARWREQGFLTINRGRIGVLNFEALEEAAKDTE